LSGSTLLNRGRAGHLRKTEELLQLRREPPVEAQLFTTKVTAPLERTQVNKWEANRPLNLVGEFASQKHP
jgi:hypothetical protein